MAKLLASCAAAALIATGLGVGSARAQGYGPYDHIGGRWYADEDRDYARLGYGVYGPARSSYARPYYFGSTAPYYGFMPPTDYSYGAPAQDNTARVRVVVPPDARVWFGNAATQQSGSVRFFQSPELTPGKDYTYDVKATWTENGKDVTRTRHADVRANATATVDFTR
jgi:uncharacterized protein (TIGR03000 family)